MSNKEYLLDIGEGSTVDNDHASSNMDPFDPFTTDQNQSGPTRTIGSLFDEFDPFAFSTATTKDTSDTMETSMQSDVSEQEQLSLAAQFDDLMGGMGSSDPKPHNGHIGLDTEETVHEQYEVKVISDVLKPDLTGEDPDLAYEDEIIAAVTGRVSHPPPRDTQHEEYIQDDYTADNTEDLQHNQYDEYEMYGSGHGELMDVIDEEKSPDVSSEEIDYGNSVSEEAIVPAAKDSAVISYDVLDTSPTEQTNYTAEREELDSSTEMQQEIDREQYAGSPDVAGHEPFQEVPDDYTEPHTWQQPTRDSPIEEPISPELEEEPPLHQAEIFEDQPTSEVALTEQSDEITTTNTALSESQPMDVQETLDETTSNPPPSEIPPTKEVLNDTSSKPVTEGVPANLDETTSNPPQSAALPTDEVHETIETSSNPSITISKRPPSETSPTDEAHETLDETTSNPPQSAALPTEEVHETIEQTSSNPSITISNPSPSETAPTEDVTATINETVSKPPPSTEEVHETLDENTSKPAPSETAPTEDVPANIDDTISKPLSEDVPANLDETTTNPPESAALPVEQVHETLDETVSKSPPAAAQPMQEVHDTSVETTSKPPPSETTPVEDVPATIGETINKPPPPSVTPPTEDVHDTLVEPASNPSPSETAPTEDVPATKDETINKPPPSVTLPTEEAHDTLVETASKPPLEEVHDSVDETAGKPPRSVTPPMEDFHETAASGASPSVSPLPSELLSSATDAFDELLGEFTEAGAPRAEMDEFDDLSLASSIHIDQQISPEPMSEVEKERFVSGTTSCWPPPSPAERFHARHGANNKSKGQDTQVSSNVTDKASDEGGNKSAASDKKAVDYMKERYEGGKQEFEKKVLREPKKVETLLFRKQAEEEIETTQSEQSRKPLPQEQDLLTYTSLGVGYSKSQYQSKVEAEAQPTSPNKWDPTSPTTNGTVPVNRIQVEKVDVPPIAKNVRALFESGNVPDRHQIKRAPVILNESKDAGTFENEPAVREGVTRESDAAEDSVAVQEGHTKSLLGQWKTKGKNDTVVKEREQIKFAEGDGKVSESQPVVRDDVVREGDRDIMAELPRVGHARGVRSGWGKNQPITPERKPVQLDEDHSGPVVLENEPVQRDDVVRGEDENENLKFEWGRAKKMADFFVSQTDDVHIERKPIHIDRDTQPIVLESEPEQLQGVVRESDLPEEEDLALERGRTAKFAQFFQQAAEDEPRKPRQPIKLDYGDSGPSVLENEPEVRSDVVRHDDLTDNVIVRGDGQTRNIASRFLGWQEEEEKQVEMRRQAKKVVIDKSEGPCVVENEPEVRADVVRSDEYSDETAFQQGRIRNMRQTFHQKEMEAASVQTSTSRGSGRPTWLQEIQGSEGGVFENQPQVREDVHREADFNEEPDLIPEQYAKSMRQSWQRKPIEEEDRFKKHQTPQVVRFTPPREMTPPRIHQPEYQSTQTLTLSQGSATNNENAPVVNGPAQPMANGGPDYVTSAYPDDPPPQTERRRSSAVVILRQS